MPSCPLPGGQGRLYTEIVVYGVSRRVSFKPRADYRLIVSEMSLAR